MFYNMLTLKLFDRYGACRYIDMVQERKVRLYKIMFIRLGMNGQYNKSKLHLRVDQNGVKSGKRLQLFCSEFLPIFRYINVYRLIYGKQYNIVTCFLWV
jgi:hypothetical protein